MVEAESPFRTLLLCKKSKTTGSVALCRASVTSVVSRRHKGPGLRADYVVPNSGYIFVIKSAAGDIFI